MSFNFGPHDYDCTCWRCQSRRAVNTSVSVRASLAEIESLGPERAKAFLEGIGKVVSAGNRKATEGE